MCATPSKSSSEEIDEELAKIGYKFPLKQKGCPWLIRFALRTLAKSIERGELPLWLKILLHLRFGKFKTPSGIEYKGFKISFKW